MANKEDEHLPFSARYSLPVHVSQNLGNVSWETVADLSTDFQAKIDNRRSKVSKLVKELELSRMLLLDKIKQKSEDGRIDPMLIVEVTRLLQKCEEVAAEYEIDLKDFSNFLYLICEKLKKEKLIKYRGPKIAISRMEPIKDELSRFKSQSENNLPSGKIKKKDSGKGKKK